MTYSDHTYYCTSYIPDNFDFAVLGTIRLLEEFSTIAHPMSSKTLVGAATFISKTYDDVYLIPMLSRLKYTKEFIEIPTSLKYEEYLALKEMDTRDFKLDHENESIVIKYPLSFSPEVDQDINFKIHKGKLYKRKRIDQYGSIFHSDWELILFSHHLLYSHVMDDAFSAVMKELLGDLYDREND